MKRIAAILAALALLALPASPVHTAETKDKATAAQVHKGQGTVNRIDEKSGKINMAHGPIASLKWPAMTMDFQVKDAAVLKGVAPGQKVEFDIVQTGPSQFVITRIAPADGSLKSPRSSIDDPKAAETAFGRAGDAKQAVRTVRVEMDDKMRFTPAVIEIKQGDTVKFVITNSGNTMHEMVIGSLDELKAHSATMKKHPGMDHDEAYMTHVPPGKTGSIVWQFTKAGEFSFGCLVPGHFEAGMVGKITVLATAKQASK